MNTFELLSHLLEWESACQLLLLFALHLNVLDVLVDVIDDKHSGGSSAYYYLYGVL